MLKLHARVCSRWDGEPVVVRLSTNRRSLPEQRGREAYLLDANDFDVPEGFLFYCAFERQRFEPGELSPDRRLVILPDWLEYLSDGDIVRLSPATGHLSVLYRRTSPSNSMLLTERCNSNCIMCSQPPKAVNDRHLVQAYLQAIPLMDPLTAALGITGGEPTLLGQDLFDIITTCRNSLPNTALHMLSNGRMFNYLSLCERIAAIGHPNLMIGIPLYSDLASGHDFVVQASGAFDQTIRGIMNLERCGQRVEVRVVLHRQTIDRLAELARFIARNLPFVEHVALMGLEMMGYVRMNLDALWIDPVDYQAELAEAVQMFAQHRMNVSIYNHQLCTLDERLWGYARQSISDWKNEYLPACDACSVREACGGFFASADIRHSDFIHPISSDRAPSCLAS